MAQFSSVPYIVGNAKSDKAESLHFRGSVGNNQWWQEIWKPSKERGQLEEVNPSSDLTEFPACDFCPLQSVHVSQIHLLKYPFAYVSSHLKNQMSWDPCHRQIEVQTTYSGHLFLPQDPVFGCYDLPLWDSVLLWGASPIPPGCVGPFLEGC